MINDKMIETGSPIKDFISKVLKEIDEGIPKNYKPSGKIDFELLVAMRGQTIQVVNPENSIEREMTQKIKFSVIDKDEADRLDRRDFVKNVL